jgi:hypothetical protein
MKVFVYVDALKAVGDIDKIKPFAPADAAKIWLEKHDWQGEALEYEVSDDAPEPDSQTWSCDASLG